MASKLTRFCRVCSAIKYKNPLFLRPLSTSSSLRTDVKTHTGQQFDSDDHRMVRFGDHDKVVNKKFAIDLIDEIPPTASSRRIVSCDGGGGPLGHPKVYINLDQPGNHICGYCGLRFYKEDHH